MLFNAIKLRFMLFFSFLILISTFCTFVFNSEKVLALKEYKPWSWTSDLPSVFSSTLMQPFDYTTCDTLFQKEFVIGELGQKDVCMMPGDKIRFGTYYNGNQTVRVVGFGYDDKMYKVWNACDSYGGCMYLSASDTLITKQYQVSWSSKTIMVYKNFTKRLKQTIMGTSIGYRFDDKEPDYVFNDFNGNMLRMGGFGVSDDGNWLAAEIIDKGIGVLDIKNLKMRFISKQLFYYGGGYNPMTEIAISNGGQHVAVMGINSDFTIYDTPIACGDEANRDNLNSRSPLLKPCASTIARTGDFIKGFFFASDPKFNSDGGQLDFYTESYYGEFRSVSIRANGYVSRKVDYLALGDSFSSGEGENDDTYYIDGTNSGFEKCHVSSRSYPYLVAGLSDINPGLVKNVSCSGATTKDIVGNESIYNGQGGRLGDGKLNLDDSGFYAAKSEAGKSFLPGRILQSNFVKEHSPSVITVGIGGNDVGFMDKLRACIGKGTCSWAINSEDKEQAAIEIKNIFYKLVETYQKLISESPKSKIIAIGYPKIISENGECNLIIDRMLDYEEKRFINEGVMYLNKVISAAAKNVGIGYVDIENSYGEYVLCGSGKQSAMNSIAFGDDGAISNSLSWLKVIGQESFHPNSLGHSMTAGSIGNIFDYDYCDNGQMSCPSNVSAPEPSLYWIPEITHDYPLQKNSNFVFDNISKNDNIQKRLKLDSYSFAPNSEIKAEMSSKVINLGIYSANTDGSFDAIIDLPQETDDGYHTIRLYGTSYSGEAVELYQVIKVNEASTVVEDVINTTSNNIASSRDEAVNSSELKNNEIYTNYSQSNEEVKGASNTSSLSKIPSEPRTTKKIDSMFFTTIIVALLLFVIVAVAIGLRNDKIGSIR